MSMKPSRLLPTLILLVSACVGSPGPSNVSQGKQYVSGNAQYDEFFSEMYELQVTLGAAPDRERTVRQHLAAALDIDPSSRAEEIAEAVNKRVAHMNKRGPSLKLALSGMEEKGTPSSVLTATGTVSDPKDKALVEAIDQAGKDAAALLGDVRRASAATEHLRAEAPALEPSIDETFRLAGPARKADVRKNLEDAERLIPLMAERSSDIEERTTELLRKLEKSLSAQEGDEGAEKTGVSEPETGKKGKEKVKGARGESKPHAQPKPAESKPHAQPKPAEPKPAAPSEETAAPKKPAPKPAAPPSDDFEP